MNYMPYRKRKKIPSPDNFDNPWDYQSARDAYVEGDLNEDPPDDKYAEYCDNEERTHRAHGLG